MGMGSKRKHKIELLAPTGTILKFMRLDFHFVTYRWKWFDCPVTMIKSYFFLDANTTYNTGQRTLNPWFMCNHVGHVHETERINDNISWRLPRVESAVHTQKHGHRDDLYRRHLSKKCWAQFPSQSWSAPISSCCHDSDVSSLPLEYISRFF